MFTRTALLHLDRPHSRCSPVAWLVMATILDSANLAHVLGYSRSKEKEGRFKLALARKDHLFQVWVALETQMVQHLHVQVLFLYGPLDGRKMPLGNSKPVWLLSLRLQ